MGTGVIKALAGNKERKKAPIPVWSSSLSRGPAQNQRGKTAAPDPRRKGLWGKALEDTEWSGTQYHCSGSKPLEQSCVGSNNDHPQFSWIRIYLL